MAEQKEHMQNKNNKMRASLASGLAKGWSGFVWIRRRSFAWSPLLQP